MYIKEREKINTEKMALSKKIRSIKKNVGLPKANCYNHHTAYKMVFVIIKLFGKCICFVLQSIKINE